MTSCEKQEEKKKNWALESTGSIHSSLKSLHGCQLHSHSSELWPLSRPQHPANELTLPACLLRIPDPEPPESWPPAWSRCPSADTSGALTYVLSASALISAESGWTVACQASAHFELTASCKHHTSLLCPAPSHRPQRLLRDARCRRTNSPRAHSRPTGERNQWEFLFS